MRVYACSHFSSVDAPSFRYASELLWHAELAYANTVRLATASLSGLLRAADRGGGVCCRDRRLLMAVTTNDWQTFAVLACSRADPAGLSDGTVAKCREANRMLTEWKQLPG